MPLFSSSTSSVQQPGVFLIELAPPTVIDGVNNGYVGLVFQGEWGPVNALYLPTSGGDMINHYFPPGTLHTSTGYYAVMRRKQVPWAMVRVLDGTGGLTPPTNVTITQTGTPGVSTVSYTVTALNAAGETMASAVYTTSTANATLNGSNFNVVTWPAVTGATTYSVYRTVGGPSQGKVSTAQAGLFYNDQGGAAAGSSPASNASGYAPSVCNLLDASNVPVLNLIALYPGTVGNVMTATVAAASDGVANHYNLTVTLSNANTGSTNELYSNCQTQATAILPGVTSSLLLASAALINTPVTRPLNGTYTFYNASNGPAVSAADYNAGFTQLATNNQIRVVCVDDCGDSIRSAVNVNLQAHVDNTGNRMAVMQGPAGNALSAVLTDVTSYRDDRIIYCGSWVTCLDDLGTAQQSPFSTFVASALVNNDPSWSHAWWDDRVTTFYNGVNGFFNQTILNPLDDGTKNQCTQSGVLLPTRLDSGKYAGLHDRTTNLTSGKTFAVTRRIKDYLGISIKAALPGFVNGPNTVDQQRQIVGSINEFLSREQTKGRIAANAANPTLPGFIVDGKTGNTQTTLGLGQFVVNITATTPAPMEKIFIQMQVGPTVTVNVQ